MQSVTSAAENSQGVPDRAGYVDDQTCAECHQQIAADFADHPMGRSLAPIAGDSAREPRSAEANNPFVAHRYQYQVLSEDGPYRHQQARVSRSGELMAHVTKPIAYVVGSGQRGRSYLVDEGGHLVMSPITWYPQRQIWDLSPGYEVNNSEFHRPVTKDCLFCHCNHPLSVPHTLNRYQSPIFSGYAIGCQRCHGPGERHVRLRRPPGTMEGPDPIVNPAHLAPAQRDAVCQQCHLAGIVRVPRKGRHWHDFRPGEAIGDWMSVFVQSVADIPDHEFLGHVEQMEMSRCYQASNHALGCISCHDPHRRPSAEEQVSFYRARCLKCHAPDDCDADRTARDARRDSCWQCHMPSQSTEIRHAATSDHRIPRIPSASISSGPSKHAPRQIHAFGAIVPPARDLAIAVIQLAHSKPELVSSGQVEQSLELLQDVLVEDESDLDVWQAIAGGWRGLDRLVESLMADQQILRRVPRHEIALADSAAILGHLDRHDEAIEQWKLVLEVNPTMVRYWHGLARSYAARGDWASCLATCQQSLEEFPTSVGIRQLLIEAYLRLERREEAAAAFAELEQFDPEAMDELRSWYARQVQ